MSFRSSQRMFTPPDQAAREGPDRDPGRPDDEWMVTWADAITVLLGFFVLLFSLSQVDTERFDEVREALSGDRLVPQPLPSDETQTRTGPELAARMTEVLSEATFAGEVRVDRLPAGVVVELRAADLFGDGAALRPEVVDTMATLAWELRQPDMRDYMVEVQGLGRWQDSGPKSLALTQFFHEQGVPVTRLRATAFGDQQPYLRQGRGRSLETPDEPAIRVLLERP